MTISAVLTPCSARKQKLPVGALNASRQRIGAQSEVAHAWVTSLTFAEGQVAAQDLYQGASFSRLRRVAASFSCSLFVVSAGLGLVAGTTRVPAYDLTLSPSAPTRIQTRITDRFDAATWWQQIQSGRFASPLESIATGQGRILMALTKPYALLVGAALAQLPPTVIQRLRIFGTSLERFLSTALRTQVMPYDARLDVIAPGTRLDFSSRALAHFAALIATQPLQGAEDDAARVRAALEPTPMPQNALRPQASDEEVLRHIAAFVQRDLPSTSALRELRECLGIACEQSRFRRLYRSVSA